MSKVASTVLQTQVAFAQTAQANAQTGLASAQVQAQISRFNDLVVQSLAVKNEDSQLGLLLAIESVKLLPDQDQKNRAISEDIIHNILLDENISSQSIQLNELIMVACLHITRNLTRDEWNQYIGDALPYQAACPNLPIESESTPVP